MPSGGARARSGPAPDPNALRRDRDGGDWWSLPAAGRQGEPPAWPLTKALKRELELWALLWAKPQGVAWERLGLELDVALYVRRLVEAEMPLSATAVGTLVKQLGEALGLSVPGLARNRWRITTAAPVEASKPVGSKRPSSRDRLQVVHGDGA